MATNIKLKSSSVAGKTPTLSDLSLRELAVNTVDGKLFLRKGDGSGTDKIIDVTAPLQASEPMGHENKSQSTISFNTGTRVFTIQPVVLVTSFNVWCKGIKYSYTTAQTVTIPNTTGLYYIYFDSNGVLQYRTSYFDWENDAPTAYVYWNATTGTAPFIADERHGIVLDWQTHEYLHRTRGAVIANGFSISNYTTTGTGSSDSDAQFDLAGGTFFDEDLEVLITHSSTPTADTWEQQIKGPARIPIFYQSGNAWIRDTPTDYALKQGTSRIKYNLFSGGTWTAPDVSTDTWYTTSWIIATNNINYPVIAIMGQSAANKISDEEALTFGDLTLDGFPVVEFRPLWKIIWQTDSGYTNTPKARIAGVYDIRQLTSGGGISGTTPVSDHGLLTGLGDDDHLQYLHVTETRTGVTAEFNTTGKITTTSNIGVGVTNPIQKVHIDGSTLISNNNYYYGFSSAGNQTSLIGITSSNNIIIGQNNVNYSNTYLYGGTGNIYLSAGNDNRLIVTSAGNIGIGTTNPGSKLHVIGRTDLVAGGVGWDDGLNLYSPDLTNRWNLLIDNGTADDLRIAYNNSERLRFESSGNSQFTSGNLGIGTTPLVKFHVLGSNTVARVESSTPYVDLQLSNSVSSQSYIQYNNTTLNFFAASGSNPTLSITGGSPGNVGIGTASPGSKLAVNGYITESTDSGTTYWNVVTQQDIGTSPNQVPLNQYLGQLAFLDDFSPNGLRREGGSVDTVVVNSNDTTTFYSAADYQIILNGNGTTWAGILFADPNGSDPMYYYGATGTFSLGGPGAPTVAGKKLHVDGGVTIGSSTEGVVMPTDGLYVQGNIQTAGALHGPANFVIDPAAIGDDTGTVEIKGNLTVQGTTTTINSTTIDVTNLKLEDNERLYVGTDNDLQIYHSGSHSYIKHNGTGNLYTDIGAADYYQISNSESETIASFQADGAVELFYDGIKKFETTSTGATINGDLYSNGNVGIGTNSPSRKLHIHAPGTDLAVIRLTGSAAGQVSYDIRQGIVNDSNAGFSIYDVNSASTRLAIDSVGNIGIGTGLPSYKLEVVGSFAATTKSFIIPHPTKEGYKLRYGSLEGPENGIYVRGKSKDSVIELPEYWVKLIDPDSITVNLTPIGQSGMPRVERIEDNKVYIFTRDPEPLEYFYMVLAERVDVDKLEVEVADS